MRKRAGFGDGLVENVITFSQQDLILSWTGITEHLDGNLQPSQILTKAVVQFARDSAALLVLDTQQPAAKFSQGFFSLAPSGDVNCDYSDLAKRALVFANGEKVYQPMPDISGLSGQFSRDLSVEDWFACPEHLTEQAVGLRSTLAKKASTIS